MQHLKLKVTCQIVSWSITGDTINIPASSQGTVLATERAHIPYHVGSNPTPANWREAYTGLFHGHRPCYTTCYGVSLPRLSSPWLYSEMESHRPVKAESRDRYSVRPYLETSVHGHKAALNTVPWLNMRVRFFQFPQSIIACSPNCSPQVTISIARLIPLHSLSF